MAEGRQDQTPTVVFSIMENSPCGHVSFQVPTRGSWANSRIFPVHPRPSHSPSPTKVSRQWRLLLPVTPGGNLGVQPGMAVLGACQCHAKGAGAEVDKPTAGFMSQGARPSCAPSQQARGLHTMLSTQGARGGGQRSVLAGTPLLLLLWPQNSPFPARG